MTSLESKGEGHSFTVLCRMALGMVYREQGRYDEAETQFTKLLPISESYITDESVHIANLMHQLAALYQQQGRYAEAEKLHLRILNIRQNLLVENHPHTLGTIRGLIALYTAWGKPQEARKWFGQLETAYTNQAAANHYTMAEGTAKYDPVAQAYTLTAAPLAPWAIEKELDFSYPEPGSEMWHVCDDLHFAYKTLVGDGSITAQIGSIDSAYYATQAGVMIRQTLDPASPHTSIVITRLGDVIFQYREIELGATHSIHSSVDKVAFPHWVQLTRTGSLFGAYHSRDGVNWKPIRDGNLGEPMSVEIPMGESVHIGLVAASYNPNQAATATMSNVTVVGSVSTSGPLTTSQHISLQTDALQNE